MRIGCVCPTYKRPLLLGRAIHCFLQQAYDNAYLIVLDDAGQYQSREHQKWRLVSTSRRYPSLGAKRQAGIGMLPDCDAYMPWDDDDVYWPHAVGAIATALQAKPWAQCRRVFESVGPRTLAVTAAFRWHTEQERELWGYGGCWGYRLGEHQELGGYDPDPRRSSNDDLDLACKFHCAYGASADSTEHCPPWYWYNRDPGVRKISDEGKNFWHKRIVLPFEPMDSPPVGWNGPNLYRYRVLDEREPRPLGWQIDKNYTAP